MSPVDLPVVATPEDVAAAVAEERAAADVALAGVVAAEALHETEQDTAFNGFIANARADSIRADVVLEERIAALEAGGDTTPRPPTTVGVPYTVITKPDDASIQAGIKAWLADRASGAQFRRSNLLFNFVAEATIRTPLLGDYSATGLIQGLKWYGLGEGRTILKWVTPNVPLMTSRGQMWKWDIGGLSIASGVADAQGIYLWSGEETNGVVRANQNGKFSGLEFRGGWDYCIGLDGNAKANLNSEVTYSDLSCNGSAFFKRALWVMGMSPEFPQQDQFLNQHFMDTTFEGSHGTYLLMPKGGFVTIDGYNSWLYTGSASLDGKPRGTMVVMPKQSHFDSTQKFIATSVRAELRSDECKVIDCSWTPAGRVTWLNHDASSWTHSKDHFEAETYRGGARVKHINSTHGGWIGLRDEGGDISLDGSDTAGFGGKKLPRTMADDGLVRNYSAKTAVAAFV